MAVTIDKQGNERGIQEISIMGVEEPSRYADTVIDESFAGANQNVDMLNTHTQSQMQV